MPKKSLLFFITTVSVIFFTCEHHNPFNPRSPDYEPPKITITGIDDGVESDSTASETITVYVSANHSEVDLRYSVDSVWTEWVEDFEGDSITVAIHAIGQHIITLQGRYDEKSATCDTFFTVYKVEHPDFIPDSTSLLADSLIQISEGENCTLTVRSTGTPPFTLQWYHNTILIDSSNTDTLIIIGFNEADSGLYYSIIQGRWGEARSDSVFIRYLPPVNHDPVGQPDSFNVNEDDTLATDSEQSFLKNDSDADHDSLNAILTDSTRNGSVALFANGTFTYVPDENFSGKDSFTYRVVDSKEAESEPVVVRITVEQINDMPVVINNKSLSVYEGALTIIDTQHLFVNDIENGPDELILTLSTAPKNGYIYYSDSLITVNAVFSQKDINDKRISYRHNGSETTADTLFLKISDTDGGGIDSITVSIKVLPVNDTPYIASKLDVGVTEGGIKVISSATLVVKDNDNTASELFFTLADAPLYGSLTLSGKTLETGDLFTQGDIDSGRVSYRHDKSSNVTRDSLAFTVKDIIGASIEKTFLFIRIGAMDDPPVATDQKIATDEDTPISITLTAVDPEGVTLTGWKIVSEPAHGTLTGSGAIRSFKPEYNWNGTDTFRFRVNDGVNWSDTGIIEITVNPVNDAPEWKRAAIEFTVKEGTTIKVNLDTLLAGDPEGDDITSTKISGVGIVTGSIWTWTPGYAAAGSSPAECEISATDDGIPTKFSTIKFSINVIDSSCKLISTIERGSGTIQTQPSGTIFDPGTEVTVTAVPHTDYMFKKWTGDINKEDSNKATITISMNGNKNISATFVRIIETVTLNIGESYVHGSLYANGYYFLSTRTAPAKLLRLNADSLSDYREITFSSGFDYADQITYVEQKNKLYVAFGSYFRVAIAEVNPLTMEYTEDAFVDTVHGASPLFETQGGQSMCNDGEFLYIITARSDTSRILKYSLSTMSSVPVAVLNLPAGNVYGHSIIYENKKLYATNGYGTPWVARVDATSLQLEDIQSFSGKAFTDDMAIYGNYLFLGIEADYSHDQSGQILRVDKTNLDSYYYFDTGTKGSVSTGDGYNYAVQEFNGTIWAIFATEPGTITSINPNSLEFQNYSLPYNIPNEILSDGKRLFITYWDQDPGKVQAFDPSYLIGRETE